MSFADLERRIERVQARRGSEAHHRRIATTRQQQEAARQLAANDITPARRARLAAGMSQRTLSTVAQVSRDTVARAEDPARAGSVSAASWRRLAHALGCSPDDLAP